MKLKQVILVRQDLKLPKGKLASQVAHASTAAVLKSHPDIVMQWKNQGMKKVVLKVKDKDELLHYKRLAEDLHLETALVIDAGKTVVSPGTITSLGIGPDDEKKIDKVTGKLSMM